MSKLGPFLPYRCEAMRIESLKSPCTKNLARIKALREKWPEAHIGPLEHCLTCKGRDLIVRKEDSMAGVVKFKDENQAAACLGPEKVEAIMAAGAGSPEPAVNAKDTLAAKYCKKHPEVLAHIAKGGRSMGRCLLCLQEGVADATQNRKKGPDMRVLSPEKVAQGEGSHGALAESHRRATGLSGDAPDPVTTAGTHPLCHKHHLPLKMARSNGQLLPGCAECYQEWNQASHGKFKAKYHRLQVMEKEFAAFKASIPVGAIILDLEKFPELKAGLEANQKESMRPDLNTEVIYWLLRSMRGAAV